MPKLTVFNAAQPEVSYDRPRPDRLVRGNPLRSTREFFSAPQGDLSCGTWTCEPGAWNIAFPAGKDEFFCVINGRLRISDDQGMAAEFGPGDACVIPQGFVGTFEVLETVSKYYVVLERSGQIAL